MKIANDREVKLGEEVTLYLPYLRLKVYDTEHNKINSREMVKPNKGVAKVTVNKGKMVVSVGGANLVYNQEKGIASGEYEIIFKQDKLLPIYNKKLLKMGLENPAMDIPGNKIKVSAYDEDVLGNKLLTYVQVNGFETYSSFVMDNKFSVYKMPKFELYVPREGFELKLVK